MSTYLFIGYLGTIVPIVAVGYLGTIVPIVAVGYLADHFGLNLAVLAFCIAVGLLCLGVLYWHKKTI